MSRPLILVSNDDGITAPGIANLVRIVRGLGAEVVVVAPDSPQSGMGHAITIGQHHILKDRNPDLVVSGINHGANASVNVLYSGTMSAAIEAAIEGLPAVGFSLCEYGHDADFSHVDEWVTQVCRHALEHGIPAGTALNVNIPKNSDQPIAGLRLCRQARAKWAEEFDERHDPYRRPYYWLRGSFLNLDSGTDTDEWALAQNYVSVVPCQFDLTAYRGLEMMVQAWQLPLPEAQATATPPQPLSGEDYGPANP